MTGGGWPVFVATRDIRARNLSVAAGQALPEAGGWQTDRAKHALLRRQYGEDVLEVRYVGSHDEARGLARMPVAVAAVDGEANAAARAARTRSAKSIGRGDTR